MALLTPEATVSYDPLPQLRRAVAADREELIRFVEDLSPSSSQLRFLTGMGGHLPRAVLDQLLSGGRGGGAMVAVVAGRLVAHALWARSKGPDVPEAEIALVVADAYQRQGLGTLLLDAVRMELICDGIERVQVVTGAANRPVQRMLARQRPGAKPSERDGAVLTFDLAVRP